MVKVRTLLGIALVMTMGVAQAATVVDADFSKGSTGFTINGTAQLLDPKTAGVTQVLSLTQHEGSQTGTAWTEAKQKPESFSFIVDMRMRYDSALTAETGGDANCPADGAVLAFAAVEPDFVGGGGGSVSLYSGEVEQFTSMLINTWRGQGLGTEEQRQACNSNNHETFEFGVVTPSFGTDTLARVDGQTSTVDQGGSKIAQVLPPAGMKIINGGFYRYQWNVAADGTMAVYVTGLEDSNKQFKNVKVIEAKFDPAKVKLTDFEGRWGIAAATGGAVQFTEVARARVEVPMIDPLP